jgi:hypothetical protein
MRITQAIACCLALSATCAFASVINVPADQPTIAAAIAAAAAGDTIKLAPGTYTEQIVVDKPLTIKGTDRDSTIITCGTEDGEVAITGNADLTLEYLTVGPAHDCVWMDANLTLRTNRVLITGAKSDGIGFAGSFQTRLYMTECEVTACGDGVDLESTQGRALACNFHDNTDDGLDYDGDAGFLCVGCRFMDNGDDGIEVRLKNRTEVVLVYCTFGGNPEDNLELINTPELDPKTNTVIVSHCRFEGAGRWDIGAVDLYHADGSRNEETSIEPPHAAVYLCANEYTRPLEEALAPNVLTVHNDMGAAPESVTVQWTPAGGEAQEIALAPTSPACAGLVNTHENYAGGTVGDAEGLAVDERCIYVGDDTGKPQGRAHCFDRATGARMATISTFPFEGTEVTMLGPEGVTVLPDGNVLIVDDESADTAEAVVITPGPDDFGRFVREMRIPGASPTSEGVTIVGETIFMPTRGFVGLRACNLATGEALAGWPVSYRFDGRGLHVAGAGYDGENIVVSATAYPPPKPNQNAPVPINYLLRVSPEDGRPLGIEWIGAYTNDARGIACADGLTMVSDGWSHRKREGGFVDKRGQKIMLLAPDMASIIEALDRLPVRHLP